MERYENLLLSVAVVAVFVSLVGAGFTYYTITDYRNTWLTGFATDEGDVLINILSSAAINFTVDEIDWGEGQVNPGAGHAILDTEGTVTDGNWSPAVDQGFEVKNIGNVALQLTLETNNDADGFLGGTDPVYEFKVSNETGGACIVQNDADDYINVNTEGVLVCNPFEFASNQDTIRIDIRLEIPDDSLTGARSSVMTATIQEVL